MNPVLLDGVGAGFLLIIFGLGVFFIILAFLLEAWIIKLMGYHTEFKRAWLDSLVANLLSLASGFVVARIMGGEAPDLSAFANVAIFFAVTMLVEFIYLFLANRSKPVFSTLKVCAVMNLVTYLIALVIIQFFYN